MRGNWLIVAAAVLWGTTGTAQALGPETSDPLSVGALRLIIGAGGLVAVWLIRHNSTDGLRWLWRPATVAAAAGMAAYQPSFFSAVDRTGVAIGTVVAIGSGPMFVGLILWALDRHRPSRRWKAATALAVTGLAIMGLPGGSAEVDPTGLVLALVAGLSYAVYAVAAGRLSTAGPIDASAAAVFGLAAIALVPLAFTADLSWAASPGGLATVLWLGLAATTVAYLLFTAGLRIAGAPTAATLSLTEPLTAALLGVLVLSERPPTPTWAGAGLIAIGLVLVGTGRRDQPVVSS